MATPSSREQAFTGPEEVQYIYDPLPPNTIRVLELWPSGSSEPHTLRGNLVIEELSIQPSYEALSYAWGLPIFDNKIRLHGGQLGITANLAAALHQIRDSRLRRRLWVDAICINQASVIEKNSQVALMAQIYENCRGCLVWLGKGAAETHLTMMALRSLAELLKSRGLNLEYEVSLSFEPSSQVLKLREQHGVDLKSLKIFLAQDWFQRLWVVQEVALPRKVTLLNGSDELKFTAFTAAINALRVLCHAQVDLAARLTNSRDLAAMRMTTQPQTGEDEFEPSDLLDLVVSNVHKKCQDPKDLIFGLLGLWKVKTLSFEADYSLDVPRSYRNFAFAYLSQNDLRPLCYAGKLCDRPVDVRWPSWVPDWRFSTDRHDARMGHRRIGTQFNSCDSRSASVDLKYEGSNVIGLVGRSIDVVEVELSSHRKVPAESVQELLEEPHKIFELRNSYAGSAYPSDQEADEAFARTLWIDGFEYLNQIGVHWKPNKQDILRQWSWAKRGYQDGTLGSNSNLPSYYISEAKRVGHRRKYFVTESGLMGLGSVHMRPGDVVVAFNGAEVPFILRSYDAAISQNSEDEPGNSSSPVVRKEWELIGDCYLHGFMDHEVLKKGYIEETFWIR